MSERSHFHFAKINKHGIFLTRFKSSNAGSNDITSRAYHVADWNILKGPERLKYGSKSGK
jgi:hypothetical protein